MEPATIQFRDRKPKHRRANLVTNAAHFGRMDVSYEPCGDACAFASFDRVGILDCRFQKRIYLIPSTFWEIELLLQHLDLFT